MAAKKTKRTLKKTAKAKGGNTLGAGMIAIPKKAALSFIKAVEKAAG